MDRKHNALIVVLYLYLKVAAFTAGVADILYADYKRIKKGMIHNEKNKRYSLSYYSTREKRNTNQDVGKTGYPAGKTTRSSQKRSNSSLCSAVIENFRGGEVPGGFIIYSFNDV